MKTIVTISRKWDNPQIETTVWKKGENEQGLYVEITLDMKNFVSALKEEIGSVATVITKEGISKKIDMAVANVLAAMKEEWVKHPD
jgi:hypothetical protein